MGIWSMQTWTAMQFPISMLGRTEDLRAAKRQGLRQPLGRSAQGERKTHLGEPNHAAQAGSDPIFWVALSPLEGKLAEI